MACPANRRRGASRRSVLKAAVALPLADALAAVPADTPHIAVVGAGAFGGWTALHLLRQGARVTLLDAWGPGNSRASSGGETRVIRAERWAEIWPGRSADYTLNEILGPTNFIVCRGRMHLRQVGVRE